MVTRIRPQPLQDLNVAGERERVVVVSNRGPVEHTLVDGRPQARVAGGGVTTALRLVAASTPVAWLAAAVSQGDKQVARAGQAIPLAGESTLHLVDLPTSAFDLHYNAFCNPMLWFLQHGLLDQLEGELAPERLWRAWEEGYLPTNQAFAEATVERLLAG